MDGSQYMLYRTSPNLVHPTNQKYLEDKCYFLYSDGYWQESIESFVNRGGVIAKGTQAQRLIAAAKAKLFRSWVLKKGKRK